jgi:hypothetical protein
MRTFVGARERFGLYLRSKGTHTELDVDRGRAEVGPLVPRALCGA